MAGIGKLKSLLIALFAVGLLQACATNEELFAEYDSKFCIVPDHPDKRFRWEPVVYFDSDKSEVLSADTTKLKINVETLSQLPDYKISLKGFADHQAGEAYNLALSQRRVAVVTDYLIDELGLDADRIVASFHGESSPLTTVISGPVDQDRRVEMLLLDPSSVPVASQPLLTGL